jgi:hypothetical protein
MAFGTLWLPVLVSAAAVWIASAIAWMMLPYHKSDWAGFADEPGIADALRKQKAAPGMYLIPFFADMKGRSTPEGMKKYQDGPVAMITVVPNGAPAMGKSLVLYFAFCVFVSFLTAYVARHTLSSTTPHPFVFRITGACAIGFYGLAHVPDSIWMGRPWSYTVKAVVDAIAYGVITGVVFMLLWP